MSGKFSEDFSAKLKINGFENEIEEVEAKESSESQILEQKPERNEEEEFSFACTNSNASLIFADDAFQNGQFRPTYPLFDRDLLFADDYKGNSKSPLKKLFVGGGEQSSSSPSETDELNGVPAETYCAWSPKAAAEASPEMCKKSNSTGSSKMRKLRELAIRSNSDGKDAFVFLNPPPPPPPSSTKTSSEKKEKEKEKTKTKGKGGKSETASSVHERLYVENRAMKEGVKRRSYLPYKQVGFFTNVNALSRNVHPF